MTRHPDLPSWRDGGARDAIVRFVASVTTGPDAVPEPERVAVFDNDGTLWSEKPMPVQLHYLVQEWRRAVDADPVLAERQPYRAAVSGDLGWLGAAVDAHYAGDDTDLKTIIGAIVGLVDGTAVDDYARSVAEFFRTASHPVLGRPYPETVYLPMIELLRYLERNGFACYIVSGGERDFMRPMAEGAYGIPPERVIGTAYGLAYDDSDDQVRYTASLSFFDDGPEKPVRIWSRVGRRPLFAAGNSNGDVPMLDFALGGRQGGFAMLVSHDDDTGRGDTPYTAGAESAVAAADSAGYTVVSVRDDWAAVFPGDAAPAP